MISKEKLDFAVKQVVEVCLKAQKGEKACVITDNETKHIGIPIADKLKSVGCVVTTFLMEDFGNRPQDGVNPLKFPEEAIGKAIDESIVSVYAAQGKTNEYQSFRVPLLDHINSNDKLRHGHMIGVSDQIMEEGMSADYNEVGRLTKKLFDLLSKADKIKISTKKGTDLLVEIDSSLKCIVDDGAIRPKHWGNLPAGEVYCCPKNINGQLIVDGVIGDYFNKYGVLEDTPVEVKIENGWIKSIISKNKILENDLRTYLAKSENGERIGEVGIGTNIGVHKLIGVLLQDEKFPGVHIAAGSPYPEKTGANWQAQSHVDMVIKKTTIEVDGKMIMKEGKFLI